MPCNIHSFPCIKERMQYLSTVALTVLFTVLFLVIYKLLINPQIVIRLDPTKMSKCPDGWTYSKGLCHPNSKTTTCLPFDPNSPTLTTAAGKCNLARTCGTTWAGMCG